MYVLRKRFKRQKHSKFIALLLFITFIAFILLLIFILCFRSFLGRYSFYTFCLMHSLKKFLNKPKYNWFSKIMSLSVNSYLTFYQTPEKCSMSSIGQSVYRIN